MIDFQQVTKIYGSQDVLADASFRVNPGERVGIVGANGSGKSTIFNLLIGAITPDSGQIALPAGLRLGHLRQHINPQDLPLPLLEYAENAIPEVNDIEHELGRLEAKLAADSSDNPGALRRLGELQSRLENLGGYELKHRAEAALSGLGFHEPEFHNKLGSFSGGWQMRAELVRVLNGNPDVLLLDEPTNFLDLPAVEWLRDYLRAFRGTLMLISHDRFLLNSLTQVTIEVAGAKVTRYQGCYEEYLKLRVQRHEQALATRKNQDRKREKLERFVERFRAKNTKAAQAQSRMKMLEKMETVEVPVNLDKAPPIRIPPPQRTGAEVAALNKAGFTYDHQRWIFKDFDFVLERGCKAAVVGYNGMGKTTLLRVLAGQLPLSAGSRSLGSNVTIGYLAQEITELMNPEHTVYAVARAAAAPGTSDANVRTMLGALRFSGEAMDKQVRVLSGGERMRLSLVRIFLNPPSFLVLDEPTTHLDISTREALQEALKKFAGTVCFVSHDLEFVRNVADTVYAIADDGITRYFGNYDYYRQKLSEKIQGSTSAGDGSAVQTDAVQYHESTNNAADAASRKDQKRLDAARRQQLYRLRQPLEKELQTVEKKMAHLEAEQGGLMIEVSTPQLPAKRLTEATRRLKEIQDEISKAGEVWEEIALKIEELED